MEPDPARSFLVVNELGPFDELTRPSSVDGSVLSLLPRLSRQHTRLLHQAHPRLYIAPTSEDRSGQSVHD